MIFYPLSLLQNSVDSFYMLFLNVIFKIFQLLSSGTFWACC
jgi:hypothetical protein